MRRPTPTFRRTTCTAAALAVLAGCHDATAPRPQLPAHIKALPSGPASAAVGTTLVDPITVSVTDSSSRPVRGVQVFFKVTTGNGSVSPTAAVTGNDGRASTRFTLGARAGPNVVRASLDTTPFSTVQPAAFSYVGTPTAATILRLGPRPLRFPLGTDSLRLTTVALDSFGNRTNDSVVFQARDPTLVTVDVNGVAHVQRRGGTTYVIAATGVHADSALAIVLAPGDSPCTDIAPARTMAPGEVVSGISAGGDCVRAGAADEEYALIPYFFSIVPTATIQLGIRGEGLASPSSSALGTRVVSSASRVPARVPLAIRFERDLRAREALEMRRHVAGARAWYAVTSGGHIRLHGAAPPIANHAALAAGNPGAPTVGSIVSFNTNANDGCSNPTPRFGRVAAVSERAIVVADTGNPAGGFTDADYQGIATTFDTLVDTVDEAAFGSPTDIDGNGRVIMFFTRDVNAMSPRGSSSVILGFFFSRDLLPKTSAQGACAGSNVAEMFYLLAADPSGSVSDPRSKSFVLSVSSGTVAHEFQHLINASRRLYVNHALEADEEAWLNEGLSHIAEELVFYRASGLRPRQNLDGAIFGTPRGDSAYVTFARNNANRYRAYLQATAVQGPIGISGADDDLETRGAIWSFLRYAADRLGSSDGTLWYRLVNSQTIGLANLQEALGTDPLSMMRDWAISAYVDDVAPGVSDRFSQPSWNFRALYPAVGRSFPLTDPAYERVLVDTSTSGVALHGGSVAFFRFRVPAGQEALLTVSAGNQPAPAEIQLALVRIR